MPVLRREPVHHPEELIHWVAYRPGTGEIFDMLAAPERPLSPSTTFHAELSEAALSAAQPRGALVAALAAFTRPTDILCSWGHYSPNLAVAAGAELPSHRLDMRAIAPSHARQAYLGLGENAVAFSRPIPSSSVPSLRRRAWVLLNTITMQNVACPMITVASPSVMPSADVNVAFRAMPVTMPGNVIGSTTRKLTTCLPKKS